jgi:hypothetical protein
VILLSIEEPIHASAKGQERGVLDEPSFNAHER